MLHATRLAALTGSTMSAATSRIPTTRIESATVTAASAASATFSGRDRYPGDARPLLVDHDTRQWPVENRDRGEADRPEDGDEPQVVRRDGENRAEEVLEQTDVQRTGLGDEHDPQRDSGVEDEGERLISRGATPRAQELDRDATEHRSDERGQHRRHVEQDPRCDACERDVPIPSPTTDCLR